MENDEMQKRLEELEGRLKKLENWPLFGGMLSGQNIKDFIIKEDDVELYLKLFKARDWEQLQVKNWDRKILIDQYNEFNVTPFSYDLSIGDQFFSVQKAKPPEKRPLNIPYVFEPNETIVVITKERIAIPKYYSATVWPRFNMVRQGIFQSMVKIDPTWYGKLAIAMSNFSPACIELYPGKSFATLLFYTLSSESQYDLWEPTDENLKQVEIYQELPKEYHEQGSIIDTFIKEQGLDRWLVRDRTKIRVYGLKREELERLNNFNNSREWKTFCADIANSWATATHKKTKRGIVWMDALNMEDLNNIVKPSRDGRVTAIDVEGKMCSESELIQIAENYGKPFDTVAKIPLTIKSAIDKELEGLRKEIGAQVETTVTPRMIMLMFSVLGCLSLIAAAATFIIRLLLDSKDVPAGTWKFILIAAMLVGSFTVLSALFWLNRHGGIRYLHSRKDKKKE